MPSNQVSRLLSKKLSFGVFTRRLLKFA